MKNRTKIIILLSLLLLLIGLTIGYSKFGLFTAYNTFAAKKDINNGEIKLLIYGELLPNDEIENLVAKTFGFHFERIDDCTVNQVLINGVNGYNKTVKKHLIKENGDKWETLFNEKVMKEIKTTK